MNTSILLRPACYLKGLDGSDTALLEAWVAGKDFQLHNGQYCSIRDLGLLLQGTSSIWIYNPAKNMSFRAH